MEKCVSGGLKDIKKAITIPEKESPDVLKAEALMIKASLMEIKSRDNHSLQTLLQARRLSLQTYGEFSTLCARIYYQLGKYFEVKKDPKRAYECFRRSYLIQREIKGSHHPDTVKAGKVLTEEQ